MLVELDEVRALLKEEWLYWFDVEEFDPEESLRIQALNQFGDRLWERFESRLGVEVDATVPPTYSEHNRFLPWGNYAFQVPKAKDSFFE